MSSTNPIKSFEQAKGVNPDKFFDRIKAKHVIALVGAVALLIVSMGISSVSYRLHKEGADALDNHARVEENSELTYYLVVKSDGIDKDGIQSANNTVSNVSGNIVAVTDKIPSGLEFVGFKTTETGTIGAVTRGDTAASCPGHVVDDTKEARKNAGTWKSGRTEYYYHGLHYYASSRTVSFRAENIQAGCDLTVGVITRTPSLGSNTRLDFYNTANLKEGNLNVNSNTFHNWIGVGKEGAETFNVTYTYTGTVPANAPSAPATQGYAENTSVSVEASPSVDGYQFSGWQTSDVSVSNGSFTMPASTVAFTGSFTAKPAAAKYNVTYVIDGDAPVDYIAPKTKQYEAGQVVTLDSLPKNAKIDDWSFNGWTGENVELSDKGFTMPAKDVEIHGSFTQDTYKVTYAFEGDVLPPNADALLPAEQEYPAGTKVTLADNPTADGYAFTGWYQEEAFTMPAEDVTIYGEWSIHRGNFRPEISIKLAGKQEKYHEGDAVVFEISVKNPANYPITDVQVIEQMVGRTLLKTRTTF